MKLRREGVRRFLQGATVPVQLMVVSDPNRYNISVENRVFADCFVLLVDPNRR
uniref:Uncharacterized protein n=1 Tax=Aegilops tauschii subsp. strangulata TaxID=200361 RepID=A0A453ARV5_AEGTS